MKIGLMHYRIFETDGVSLEMEKWAEVLRSQGHKVFFIGGNKTLNHLCIPALNYTDKQIRALNRACYEALEGRTEVSLKSQIEDLADKFKGEMVAVIKDLQLDLIIPNNLFSLGIHPHIAIGLYKAIQETGIKVVGHHHDFYFERAYYSHPTTSFIEEVLEAYYPPKNLEHMGHVVINELAKEALFKKKGLRATVVPNVFDFERPAWQVDDYNKDFRQRFNIGDEDLLLLQATRVTNRKGIELAIDLVAQLNQSHRRQLLEKHPLYNGMKFGKDSRIVLLAVGLHEGMDGYEEKLRAYGDEKNCVIIMDETAVATERSREEGRKIYSLWDAYTACDIITYPSIFEGWGNQFLEGLFARKPMVVFEYSVFVSDIKPIGFDIVSLGNIYKTDDQGLAKVAQSTLEKAADQVVELLIDPSGYQEFVDKNFDLGKKHLSYKVLGNLLKEIMEQTTS